MWRLAGVSDPESRSLGLGVSESRIRRLARSRGLGGRLGVSGAASRGRRLHAVSPASWLGAAASRVFYPRVKYAFQMNCVFDSAVCLARRAARPNPRLRCALRARKRHLGGALSVEEAAAASAHLTLEKEIAAAREAEALPAQEAAPRSRPRRGRVGTARRRGPRSRRAAFERAPLRERRGRDFRQPRAAVAGRRARGRRGPTHRRTSRRVAAGFALRDVRNLARRARRTRALGATGDVTSYGPSGEFASRSPGCAAGTRSPPRGSRATSARRRPRARRLLPEARPDARWTARARRGPRPRSDGGAGRAAAPPPSLGGA